MASSPKSIKTTPYIGTHDGTFHCDDVTACFMLKQLNRFKDHDIVRTRNPELLAKAEIVVDVGSECDVERLRFDHHQRSFNQSIRDFHPKLKVTNPAKPIRLSSSGLIYAVFGKDLIAKLLNLGESYECINGEQRTIVDAIYEKAYVEFFEEIDAIDNGVEPVSGDNLVHNYHISSSISHRVGRLNPQQSNPTPEERLVQFKKAMNLVGVEIIEGIQFLSSIWWPARQKFHQFVIQRKEFDPSGKLVLLDCDQLVGWKSAILDSEEQLGIVGEVMFVIYRDASENSSWRVQTIPVNLKTFESRKPLLEEWRGKRDEELQKVSGIHDATFVHMAGFTGGAKSMEGAKSLALKTLGLE